MEPSRAARGLDRIFSACRAAGVPEPRLRCETDGMWLEFAFDPAYLQVLRAGQKQAEQVTEQVERLMPIGLGAPTQLHSAVCAARTGYRAFADDRAGEAE